MGTVRVREVTSDGQPVGITHLDAHYIVALTKTPHGSMIRMHGRPERIFSDEDASEIFKRWKDAR